MLEFLSRFDILGLVTLFGSLLFLGALVWVLLDNRSFEELNRRGPRQRTEQQAVRDAVPPAGAAPEAAQPGAGGPERSGPRTPRRAA